MQSDIERGISVATAPSLGKAQPQLIPASEEDLSYLKKFLTESGVFQSIGAGKDTPNSSYRHRNGLSKWQKSSLATWHSVLVSGDVILLTSLLLVMLPLFSPLQWVSGVFRGTSLEFIWSCLALLCWVVAMNVTQAQKLSYARSRFTGPCCTLFSLIIMGILLVFLSYFLLNIRFIISVQRELFFLVLAVPAFTLWRFLFASIMGLPSFHHRAVIIGSNPAGQTIAQELQRAKHVATTVLGFIDEDMGEKTGGDGLPLLGGRGVLRYLISQHVIDTIIIALDYSVNPELCKQAIKATQLGISVTPMPAAYESCTGKIPVEHVGDQWYAALPLQSESTHPLMYLCWKKALDLTCGIAGLLIVGLVLPIVALLISLDSPGPIFYSQERVGLKGKPFRIYKFRSMRQDAEIKGQAMWAARSDSRITRIGRFLRSTHLDELPQLFNVLRGDMSLIGPRPERAEFVANLEQTVPFYRSRLVVKPGLTGWAQVKYPYARSDNDALIKLQYDLYYIKRQSFMLDLSIILKTVIEVLSLRGS